MDSLSTSEHVLVAGLPVTPFLLLVIENVTWVGKDASLQNDMLDWN
jgi:hypothetical protein